VDQNEGQELKQLTDQENISSIKLCYFNIPRTSLSKARQFGMDKATQSIIAFPDDDCWYEPDTLKHVHSNFESDAQTGIVLAKWVEHDYNYSRTKHPVKLSEIRQFRTVPLSSICLFANRSIINQIKGFDERLGLGTNFSGGEDFDIVLRSSRYGKILFDPAALVHHKFDKKRFNNYKHAYNRAKGTGASYVKHKMPFIVVLRGLLSPVYNSIRQFNIYPLYTLAGRLSGMIQWKLKYPDSGN
jgi:GT2 family glycosyltransferase